MNRKTLVSKFLKPLDQVPVQAYLTEELQVPDILEWILDQVGRSEIFQTTFSISEEYLRRLHFIREKGMISRLDMILDFKATNKTVDLWVFISNVVDNAYLSDNHSKILLVKSESGAKICVITSQNLTRGNRAESAAVIALPEVYDNISQYISKTLKYRSIPLNDILGKTDTAG